MEPMARVKKSSLEGMKKPSIDGKMGSVGSPDTEKPEKRSMGYHVLRR